MPPTLLSPGRNMNDKTLADRVVTLGLAIFDEHENLYYMPMCNPKTAHRFVRDWRVAGAVLEEFPGYSLIDSVLPRAIELFQGINSTCPFSRAIMESCVEALNDSAAGK